MNQNLQIANKRGCDREPLSLILVKSNVKSISQVFTKYFEPKVYKNRHLEQYLKLKQNAYAIHNNLQTEKRNTIKQKKNRQSSEKR